MKTTINGTGISYTEGGRTGALPVVFVHGFPFSHAMWKPQLEVIGNLYRTIAYDIKGHGQSDVGDGQYTIESHVDDLFSLLDHLNISSCVIIGLSMGGYITLRALERNRDRFRAVVLCDTRSEGDTNEAKIKRFAGMQQVKKTGAADFAAGFVKAVFAPETFKTRPEAITHIQQIISTTSPLSIAGHLLALAARTDTTASLASIKLPTLILVGEFDTTTPPAASQAMHERISGSELHIVPQAAHMSNLENPDFFNEKLLYFLKQVASGGA